MDAPRGLVVEQLTSVRSRSGFEELSGVVSGQPVSVGVTDAGLFEDDARADAFAEAVRKTFRLERPGIARTLAIDGAGPRRWAVLWERANGPTLDQVLAERGPMLPDEAVQVALSVGQSLSHAHTNGVLHGSLSATWVTLLADSLSVEVRVGGFGLGLLPNLIAGRASTVGGDLEALGALLHELLTGAKPQGRVGKLPDAALHLGSVLTKCLGLAGSERYRSVAEFLAGLGVANRTRVSGGTLKAVNLPTQSKSDARTLGPWELQSLLGEGAMGQVFLGRHALLGRQAAIKVLRPEQYQREDLIQRFFQEARSVNQINHEHIVEISDFGQEHDADGKPSAVYFVMELLHGETLSARLAKGPMPLAKTLHVIGQLASALEAAHRLGVVHRDVKTDNVFLIERHGDPDYVKVLDFGVAKLTQLTPDAPTVSTMDGAIIGTPTSMSPEQASGAAVDARADVYAVGVLLYLMLSGRLPIDADTFGKLVALLLTQVPERLPKTNRLGEAIPPALAALVMRCLEKDPAKRPQSMAELRAGLTRTDAAPAAPARSGRTAGVVLGLLAVVALAAGGFVWSTRAVVPPEVLPPVAFDAGRELAVAVVTPPAPVPEVEDTGGTEPDDPPDAGAPHKPVKPVKPVVLTKELLQGPITKANSKFRACVERYPTLLPAKKGAIHMRFTVELDGDAAKPEVTDADITGDLRRCIEGVVKGMRFPRHVGPARVVNYAVNYEGK